MGINLFGFHALSVITKAFIQQRCEHLLPKGIETFKT
jgi:hypothetical protein